jgi:hypothetical protein
MVITMSILPPFTYPNLSRRSHGVITVLCDLQIFLCLTNGNVTCVPCATMLNPETSGVLMTLRAICHRLGASSTEVTLNTICSAESSMSNPASPRPPTMSKPCHVVDFPCKIVKVCHRYHYEMMVQYQG